MNCGALSGAVTGEASYRRLRALAGACQRLRLFCPSGIAASRLSRTLTGAMIYLYLPWATYLTALTHGYGNHALRADNGHLGAWNLSLAADDYLYKPIIMNYEL